MLIAFTGNGGSGKTTIARALYTKLDERDVRYIHHVSWLPQATRNILAKVWWALRFWLYFDWRIMRAYWPYVWQNRGPQTKLKYFVYMVYMAPILAYNLKQLTNTKLSRDLLVYDTDILVPLAELGDSVQIRRFVAEVILPKAGSLLVVSVSTPHDISVRRWCEREQKTFSEEQIQTLIAEREERYQKSEMVVAAISSLPHISLIRLEGTGDPEENARTILDKYEALMHKPV